MNYQDIRNRFLQKFAQDDRIMPEKLGSIGLAKNTYLDIKYQRRDPTKKTIETIRAYLENRLPKFEAVDPSKNFYCCTCEQIRPLEKLVDRWTCRRCSNDQKYRSRKKYWPRVLARKREYKLKKKYGSFASCMRTIINIKQELKKYEGKESSFK